VRDQLAGRFPKIGTLMDTARVEVLAVTAFPRAHWPKVWSTNPLERVNKEIKHRARVVGIFPNDAAVIDLVSGPSDRHAPRMAIRPTPLPVRGLHGPTQPTADTGGIAAIGSGE
jgi:putative transposase